MVQNKDIKWHKKNIIGRFVEENKKKFRYNLTID